MQFYCTCVHCIYIHCLYQTCEIKALVLFLYVSADNIVVWRLNCSCIEDRLLFHCLTVSKLFCKLTMSLVKFAWVTWLWGVHWRAATLNIVIASGYCASRSALFLINWSLGFFWGQKQIFGWYMIIENTSFQSVFFHYDLFPIFCTFCALLNFDVYLNNKPTNIRACSLYLSSAGIQLKAWKCK